MSAIILYRIDVPKHMHLYYCMDIQADLFGEWCLMREWGRIGSAGRVRSLPFATRQQAEEALERQRTVKEGRGYSAAGISESTA